MKTILGSRSYRYVFVTGIAVALSGLAFLFTLARPIAIPQIFATPAGASSGDQAMSANCSATVGCDGVTVHMEHPTHPFSVTASVDGVQVASCSFDGSDVPDDFLCRWDTVPEAGKKVFVTVVYGHSTYNFQGRMPDCAPETATEAPPPPTETPTEPVSPPQNTATPALTATATPQATQPPAGGSPTPTQTPIVAPPFPTPSATEVTPTAEIPTPVAKPPAKPPKEEVVVPTPTSGSQPGTSTCLEIDVKTIVRHDPASGNDRIIRIWVDSQGQLTRELDLFRNFPQLVGTVQSHDIDNWDGCWDYFVFQMKDETGTNLWRVSTSGSVLQQLTFDEKGAYSDVTTGYDSHIAFVEAGSIVGADSLASSRHDLEISGSRPQLLPDNKLLYSTDSSLWISNPQGMKAALKVSSKWFVPIPDGDGLYISSGLIQSENYGTGAGNVKIDGIEIAPNQYPYPLGDLVGQKNQIWWHPTGSQSSTQITGDVKVIPAFITDPEQWKNSTNTQPDWWVTSRLRTDYNSQPSDNYLKTNGFKDMRRGQE